MGTASSPSKSNRYTIKFNTKLNSLLIQNLNTKTSRHEASQFKRFINKKFKKEFTPSNFSRTIKADSKAFEVTIQLLDLIYSKATKNQLKQRHNLNLYCTVFNYNIIPKESIQYERFNKNTLSSFEYVITGDAHNFNYSKCNSSFFSPNARDKDKEMNYTLNSDSLFSKSKKIQLQSNYKVDKDSASENNEIIMSMIDVNSIHPTSTFRSNWHKANANANRKVNQQDDTETINLADESFNNFGIIQERHFNDESEQIIHFDTNASQLKLPSPEVQKKKHRAMPTKAPLVNIKLRIKDLIKQGIYEDSVLDPSEKYMAPDKSKRNKGKDKFKFNQTNAYHLNISTNINDLTVIKPDSSVANVNDNTSFLSIVDAFTQANKKTKDVIHSKTPAKSKVMKNPNYLKTAPSKSNEKKISTQKKVDDHLFKFNF